MRWTTRFNPRGGVEDFISYWREPTPYRWQILGASVALTFTLMVLFVPESQRKTPERPDVTYISTFAPDRTDAEIIASNRENQARQDEMRVQREALEERKKEMYRNLGRATGIDVDAMQERIDREQAEARAAAPRQARDTGGN